MPESEENLMKQRYNKIQEIKEVCGELELVCRHEGTEAVYSTVLSTLTTKKMELNNLILEK